MRGCQHAFDRRLLLLQTLLHVELVPHFQELAVRQKNPAAFVFEDLLELAEWDVDGLLLRDGLGGGSGYGDGCRQGGGGGYGGRRGGGRARRCGRRNGGGRARRCGRRNGGDRGGR